MTDTTYTIITQTADTATGSAGTDNVFVPVDTISTDVVEPIDSAFTSGILIPAEPAHAGEHFAYTDSILLHALAVVGIILILSVLRRLVRVFPSLLGCVLHWKDALHLEFSAKLSRDRDTVFAALFLPACLVIDRYDILLPSIFDNLSPELHFLAVVGILLLYFGLRWLMKTICKGKKTNAFTFSTADALFKTYFCVYVIISLITSGLFSIVGLSADLIEMVVSYETVVVFGLFLWRKSQILIHSCSLLLTILYLCGLEILPAAIVIAPAVMSGI